MLNPVMSQRISSMMSRPWFLPVVICLLVNGVGILLTLHTELSPVELSLLTVSLVKHNAIMSVVATSLMTLIGVTFSISMLILSTLSNQFGPRLLPNVLHSKITQYTLGLFLATFLFCVFCLYFDSTIYTRAVQSIYVLFLAIICLLILVMFVNYVIHSIQIEYILEMVRSNTKQAIKSSYNNKEDVSLPDKAPPENRAPSMLICTKKSGYVQGVDYGLLKKLLAGYAAQADIKVRAGDYVLENSLVLTLYGLDTDNQKATAEKLFLTCFRIGNGRELKQDIEFGYEQISEIAVRALSPGINDPYTARHCLWVLGDLFVYIEQYEIEHRTLYYKAKPVGWYRSLSYESLVHAALDRLRQASVDDPTVMLALYDMIATIIPLLKRRQLIRPLMEQAKALSENMANRQWTQHDQQAIDARQIALSEIAKRLDFDWWIS